jgi:hypothetical protein
VRQLRPADDRSTLVQGAKGVNGGAVRLNGTYRL